MSRKLTAAETYDLAMHLVGVHKNSAAIHNTPEDNIDGHHHDHSGPGGLRNHKYACLWYDPDEVEAVLEEAEAAP